MRQTFTPPLIRRIAGVVMPFALLRAYLGNDL
jgi:hypothetical protein